METMDIILHQVTDHRAAIIKNPGRVRVAVELMQVVWMISQFSPAAETPIIQSVSDTGLQVCHMFQGEKIFT